MLFLDRFEPAVDARVDTVAAIRYYLSAREAEELGSEAGSVAAARAEQDLDGADGIEHLGRPGAVERLRQRVTGSVSLPDHAVPDAGDVGGAA